MRVIVLTNFGMEHPDSSVFAVRENNNPCAPVTPSCCQPMPVAAGRVSHPPVQQPEQPAPAPPPMQRQDHGQESAPVYHLTTPNPEKRAFLLRQRQAQEEINQRRPATDTAPSQLDPGVGRLSRDPLEAARQAALTRNAGRPQSMREAREVMRAEEKEKKAAKEAQQQEKQREAQKRFQQTQARQAGRADERRREVGARWQQRYPDQPEGQSSSRDRTVTTRPSSSAAPSSSSQMPRRTDSETASLAVSTSAGSDARQDQLAPDDLSCELCFEWMTGHIRQCEEGHPACPDCVAKYPHCPQCSKQWILTRVRSLEARAAALRRVPCSYRPWGCTAVLADLVDLADHEHTCPSRGTRQSAAGREEPRDERRSATEDGEDSGTTIPVGETAGGDEGEPPEESDLFLMQAAVEQLREAGWPEESIIEALRIQFGDHVDESLPRSLLRAFELS
uniref:E3 ubiquitin-protein ligase Sina-like RING finger domain-containing protein n=1 Tax=Chromera velia CCMP2878 TaxID=1169474 RepID=A0A0G4GEU0_9ALVE|eukprot:Cvel_21558.t1-p1 / transcript=Cvel_21558.t1 / gene=Cvel_21558 / organism=Chromera_velia_CCMP2878 / gene_product=E3 ubiquitin-protein ligase sina, putative / transcript_product=E3 ubiquitin-protein ligase sina, putative / location=Cvel_scaffold2033:20237-21816(-) / protein_length=448 / sequence_SO=supercontig / SO=protein_coding / is_pseudo=false